MDNAILKYFQDKRRKEERERAEKARERTQRSEKVKSLKEEIARKPITRDAAWQEYCEASLDLEDVSDDGYPSKLGDFYVS